MGFENPITFLLEKLNESFIALFNAIKTDSEAAINFPAEKLRQLWLAISHMFEHLINRLHAIMRSVETCFVDAINFPAEKLRQLWLAISHMFEHLINWLHVIKKNVETGFVDAIKFPAEKLKALWVTMVDAWDPFIRWIQRVFGPEIWSDRFNYWLKFVQKLFGPEIWSDRFNHWLKFVQKLALDDTWYPILTWFDIVFPPETRAERLRHWLQVGLPFVAVAVVLGIIIYCCSRWPGFVTGAARGIKTACGWCWQNGLRAAWGIKAACGWCWQNGLRAVKKILCWGGGVKAAKMMKAPGRDVMIPRSVFEADPKGYFVLLRALPSPHVPSLLWRIKAAGGWCWKNGSRYCGILLLFIILIRLYCNKRQIKGN